MSEKMSAEEIVKDISSRLIAMGVDVGDENAIMAGVEALQREADGMREALRECAFRLRCATLQMRSDQETKTLAKCEAILNGSPQATASESNKS